MYTYLKVILFSFLVTQQQVNGWNRNRDYEYPYTIMHHVPVVMVEEFPIGSLKYDSWTNKKENVDANK